MRIISGQFRGRRLTPPKNITARPTTDFAKESLFNLLTNRITFEDCDMLDLFAGTGGIGLEFVSRGARSVTAVEMAHTQQNFIISTCKQLGIQTLTERELSLLCDKWEGERNGKVQGRAKHNAR